MALFVKSIKKATDDILLVRTNAQVWMALAWNDVQSRYHRSKLGVVWANLSIMMLVFALGPIYSKISGVPLDVYIVHLLLGLVVWNYVSSVVSESGREFITSAPYLVSFQLGYFTLLMRVVWRNFIVLCYQMAGFVVVAIIFGISPRLEWLSIIPALMAITINVLWMGLVVSLLVTRFRDFDELINNIIRLVFFVTPIMWIPEMSAQLMLIAEINPIFHLIEVLRAPLTDGLIPTNSWLYIVTMAALGWCFSLPLFVCLRSRLAFWI